LAQLITSAICFTIMIFLFLSFAVLSLLILLHLLCPAKRTKSEFGAIKDLHFFLKKKIIDERFGGKKSRKEPLQEWSWKKPQEVHLFLLLSIWTT